MEETTHTPKKLPKKVTLPTKPLLLAAGAVVVIGASFYSGVAFQKAKHPGTANTGFGTNSAVSGTGFRRRMSRSTVTAISSSSISVKDTSGNTKTYAITSSTEIDKDGQTATATDISVGDEVVVISSDGSTANRIMDGIMGGGFGGGASAPSVDQSQLQTN
jgi:pyruvate/2-oxoacid:ferredoxin oxidoreductase beta subunit